MNFPMVTYPPGPSFVEFEAVLDHVTHSDATLRRAFVKRFFDFMLAQRMNVKGDGLTHIVLAEVTPTFTATYEANIVVPPEIEMSHGFHYNGVVDWLKYAKLNTSTKDIIDVELAERLSDLRSDNPKLMFNEMFQDFDKVTSKATTNLWLDHIELLSNIGEGQPYIPIRRILTILARSYELLIAHVVTNTGR